MNKVLTVAVAAVLLLGLAHALDYPQMKEGLWSITMQTIDNPGNKKMQHTQKMCRSHAFDDHVRELSKNTQGCKSNENVSGSTYTVESECVVRGTTIKSKTVATLQGDSAAHSEGHSTYSPALGGVSETTLIQDQKWVGSCPSGIMPGDRIAEDGTVTHTWRH